MTLTAFIAIIGASATSPVTAEIRTGRAADVPLAYDDRLTGDARATLEKYYQVDAGTFSFRIEPPTEPGFAWRLSFPTAKPTGDAANDVVHADVYLSKIPGRRPAAIVLDILNGSFVISRLISRDLAGGGVHACMLHLPYYGRRAGTRDRRSLLKGDLTDAVMAIVQGVADIRRAAAVLRAMPEVDPDKVGIVGVSLGAYATCLAAGVDGTFHRAAAVLAGAPMAEVILGGQAEAGDIREKILARGYGEDDVRRALAPVEPLPFAHRIPKGSLILYAATRDEVIPMRCTLRLARALGMAEADIRWLRGSHRGVAWTLPYVLPQVARHLGGTPAGPASQTSQSSPQALSTEGTP